MRKTYKMAWTKYFKKTKEAQMAPKKTLFIAAMMLITITVILFGVALLGAEQVLHTQCDGNLITGEEFAICIPEAQNEMFINTEENQYYEFEVKGMHIAFCTAGLFMMFYITLIILGHRFISNYLDEHFVLKTKKHNIPKIPKSKYKKLKIPKKIKGK